MMIERSCRFHFGPLVLAFFVVGAALRHLTGCEHPVRYHWRHDHFARAWQKHYGGYHPWTHHYPQGNASTEKSEVTA